MCYNIQSRKIYCPNFRQHIGAKTGSSIFYIHAMSVSNYIWQEFFISIEHFNTLTNTIFGVLLCIFVVFLYVYSLSVQLENRYVKDVQF